MDNKPLKKQTRLVLMLSGGIDALLGAGLLLIGLGLLPVDVTEMGFQNWHLLVTGGLLFIVGVSVVAYNLSRLQEE